MQYPKNIYIIGAQSTGKTTLLGALQRHFASSESRSRGVPELQTIAEVARKAISELQIHRTDVASSAAKSFELQTAILAAQHAAEAPLARDSSTWFISDRSGMDPAVYTSLYAGGSFADMLLKSKAWQELKANMREGLIVLCESGSTWLVDDGVRLMPRDAEEWARTHNTFERLLHERGLDFITVPNDLLDIGDRIDFVLRAHC